MSVANITPQNAPPRADLQLSDLNPAVQSDFWRERSVQNSYFGLTSAEATRLTLRILAICAVSAAGCIVSLSSMGIIVGPATLLAIPCLLGAIGAIWFSINLDDYGNPEDLETYRRDAMGMGLEDVAQSYGWTHVLQWGIFTPDLFVQKYRSHLHGKNLMTIINYYEKVSTFIAQVPHSRYQYQLPSPQEWRGQWRKETAALTFEQIIQTYQLEKLEKYHILQMGELNRLKDLKLDLDEIKKRYQRDIATIEQGFIAYTADFKRTYDTACAEADRTYNSNSSLRNLREFELSFVRERATVQSQLSRRRGEAKMRFDSSVASLTKNGLISQQRLQPAEKVTYKLIHSDLNRDEAQAEREFHMQIEEVNKRCQMDQQRLNEAESIARGERDRTKNQAKAVFDDAVATMKLNKIERLRPIEVALQSAISDVNHRYKSYLRTIR